MKKHIGTVHNKVETYLPAEFWLPRSSRGNFLKVPSTAGPASDVIEDQDQHEDQGENSSSQICPEADLASGKTQHLDERKEKDSGVDDEKTGEEKETKEEVGSLCQDQPKDGGEDVVVESFSQDPKEKDLGVDDEITEEEEKETKEEGEITEKEEETKEGGEIMEEEETKEGGESLYEDLTEEDGEDEVGEKPFEWTVAERESCFNSDSDD